MGIKEILINQNIKLAASITGGATSFIPKLLGLGGMSSVLLDAQVPYSQKALCNYIGEEITEKFNSYLVAEKMAKAAFEKCKELNNDDPSSIHIGIGITASLGYIGQREGRENSIHLCIFDGKDKKSTKYFLDPERESREQQEVKSSEFVFTTLASFISKYIKSVDTYNESIGVRELFSSIRDGDPEFFIYCGSFNPVHEGHKAVIDAVNELIQENAPGSIFVGEMTTVHHNKVPENPVVIVNRAKNAAEYLGIPVFVTQQALLEEKIKNIDCYRHGYGYFNFVMGYDVYEKVVNTESTRAFLMNNYNIVKLLVFPRNGVSITETQVRNHPFLSHLCLSDTVQNVKIEMSSTQIRNESIQRE